MITISDLIKLSKMEISDQAIHEKILGYKNINGMKLL